MKHKKPLWNPSQERIDNSNMTSFISYVNSTFGKDINNYDELYNWSITEISDFWKAISDFGEIKFSQSYQSVISGNKMIDAKWFSGAKLNFAENLLKYKDSRTALISISRKLTNRRAFL